MKPFQQHYFSHAEVKARSSITTLKMFSSLVVALFLTSFSFAQSITVTGKVSSPSGLGLAGASVDVQGQTNGTSTDASGNYSINVASNATLSFSYVGYSTQSIAVGGRSIIDVQLSPDIQTSEAVVVVGYGTQRKKDVTGAVASISGSEIASQPVQTATQAIQGKVAGVQVISSGEPNSLPIIRFRGTGSILAGANPLYVVDGVLTDDIRNISNADILTMDLLKDASATAIYGVRGANGVIIITTKKGRPGKAQFSYSGTAGAKEATNLVDMAGEKQYAGYLNEANQYYGSGTDIIPASSLKGYNTDWYDAILRTAFQQTHNLSVSGGDNKFLYFLSGGFLQEDGILKNNKYNRFTLRSNNEYTFSKAVKLTSQISFSRGEANGAAPDAFINAYRAAPFVASKVGNLYGNTSLNGNVPNPLLDIEKNYNKVLGNKIQGNFGLDIKPIKHLTLRSAFNFDLDFTKGTSYGYTYTNDTLTFLEAGGNQNRTVSNLSVNKQDNSILIWDNTATYDQRIGKSNFTILGGYVAELDKFNQITGTALDVSPDKNQWYLNSVSNGSQTVINDGDKRTRISYLGRVNYGYDNRYLITATLRADGSSKFGKNQRYGYFPAVAVGWNIAQESFMQNQKAFNVLKLRASYGKKGNDNIASNAFTAIARQGLTYYYPTGGIVSPGISFPDLIDPNVHWENTKELDLGLDFTILNRRLSGTFDYYNKKTDDALIIVGLPAISGDDAYLTNATSISNKGVELSLNWADKISKDITYSVGGNISHNKNNIEKLNGGQPIPFFGKVGNYQPTLTNNGYAIATYYVLQADGVFQNQTEINASAQPNARAGDLRYKDLNNDGKINDNDKTYSGSYQPKITYGVNGNLAYKGVDMSFSTYGTQGAKIYNGKKAARGSIQPTDNLEAKTARDRWTPNNPNTGIPRATLEDLPASTYFIESGDFFRMNNLSLGYTFSDKILSRAKVNSFRLYVTAQNLFTVTPYSGFTPEIRTDNVLNNGVDVNTYPSTRTYAVGINLGF